MPAGKITLSQRFGRWTVIQRGPSQRAQWLCRCDCGREALVRAHHLKTEQSQGCGSCAAKARAITHGLSKTTIYKRWRGMIDRCHNSRTPNYRHYGGRGITVCERWHIFENFLADMGEPPPGLTIERVNNELGYCLENCRWASKGEQARNRRPRDSWVRSKGWSRSKHPVQS